MPFTAADKKLFDRLNKRYKQFKMQGVMNNTWALAVNELNNIYADADMRDIDTSRWGGLKQNVFTLSKNTDEQTLKAMRKVAKYLDSVESSKISYYKNHKNVDERAYKAYLTMLDRPDNSVEDLQTYIDMLDDMEQSKDIKGLREALSSDLIMRTYDYARSMKLTEKQVNKIIERGLKKTLQGDPLYSWMKAEILKAYNKKAKVKVYKTKSGDKNDA